MTEEEANNKLIVNHDKYFNVNKKIKTRYAAVVKSTTNFEIKDDYYIEIRLENGKLNNECKRAFKGIKRTVLQYLEIDNTLIIEDEKGFIDIGFIDEIEFQNKEEDINSESKIKYNKLTAGISVFSAESTNKSGTAGAFFQIENDDNNFYMLSNYHVLCNKNGEVDDLVVQPSIEDANSISSKWSEIGKVFWVENINSGKINIIDAAILKLNKGITVDKGRYTRCKHISFLKIGQPKIGQKVNKCGKTTGFNTATIKSINCTVNIGNKKEENYLFKNQILLNNMSKKGDSGSVLVTDQGIVVGLLFAGNETTASFANNINTIFEKVNACKGKFKIKQFV